MSKKEKLKKLIKELLKEKETAELSEFERKRRDFTEQIKKGYSPSAGELANYLEGLTADGCNRHGQKVSFIEGGEPVFRRRRRSEKMSENIS